MEIRHDERNSNNKVSGLWELTLFRKLTIKGRELFCHIYIGMVPFVAPFFRPFS